MLHNLLLVSCDMHAPNARLTHAADSLHTGSTRSGMFEEPSLIGQWCSKLGWWHWQGISVCIDLKPYACWHRSWYKTINSLFSILHFASPSGPCKDSIKFSCIILNKPGYCCYRYGFLLTLLWLQVLLRSSHFEAVNEHFEFCFIVCSCFVLT